VKLLIIVIAVFYSSVTLGQVSDMIAQGKVTDALTNKGVKAAIRYSSVPTGSITGKFNDSTFSFPIFGDAKYKVTAEAAGYTSKTVLFDPKEIDSSKTISRVIRLMPKGETIRLDHLIFSQGKATIEPDSFNELDELVLMMTESKSMVIQLEGHTDNQGSAEVNMKLSQKRVDAVKRYLVKKGISKRRVKTKAFGGTKPLANELTPEQRVYNRRVEMRILKD
jgi:OmpA-OmpF porin, OOP family